MPSEKTVRMGDKAKPLAVHGRRFCYVRGENTLQTRLFQCVKCRITAFCRRRHGWVAGCFFSNDDAGFTLIQMGFATLVLAAFMVVIVFWQALVEYYRALWKT
jgi:hypothetical protein